MSTILWLAAAVAVLGVILLVTFWRRGRRAMNPDVRGSVTAGIVLFVVLEIVAVILLGLALLVFMAGGVLAQDDGHHHPLHQDFYRHWKQPDRRGLRNGNELYRAVAAAVPRYLSVVDRDDVIADVVMGVLDGSHQLDGLAAAVKQSSTQHHRLFGGFNTVSIDRPLFAGSDLTIGDRLVAPDAHPFAD